MRFKPIPEAPYYLVSDEGHVCSLSRRVFTFNGKVWCYRQIPTTYPLREKDIRGYKNISIIQYDKNYRPTRRYMKQVHRLVLETFNPVPNMKDLQVNHIDGNKGNNKLSNLEWVTARENTQHAVNVLGHHRNQDGELNLMAKLHEWEVRKILELLAETNLSYQEIADRFAVTRGTIRGIANNTAWKCVDRTKYDRRCNDYQKVTSEEISESLTE